MAEAKGTGILALAQKQISRTKTKVLQNLGVAEKTTDDVFNDIVLRIEKQQEVAQHLQKELKAYTHCLREMSVAHKNLTTAVAETYEQEWTKESDFRAHLQAFDLLWNDSLETLQDSVMASLNNYLQQFPALKAKIAKRGRKMVDYDNSRHNLEVLQQAKKKDEAKIQKAEEERKDAKKIYEELNNELHTELPEFINSRVTFYAGLMSSLFSADLVLYTEMAKVDTSLNEICKELAKDFEQFAYHPKPLSKSPSINSGENGLGEDKETGQQAEGSKQVTDGSQVKGEQKKISAGDEADISDDEQYEEDDPTYHTPASNDPIIPVPADVLYSVQAKHKYVGEHKDELSFEPGEIIYVIPHEKPEELDENWQMGVKALDGIRGVFPENFTQKI